jgi:hypothetical protein
MENSTPELKRLRRHRAAVIGGVARVELADPEEIAEARRRGGEVRGAQLRGDSQWGRNLAAIKRLRRYGVVDRAARESTDLLERIARLEAALGTKTDNPAGS